MKKYLCILRGINVSGKNLIKMEFLRKAFEKMGFTGVETYIQSGNVVFESIVSDVKLLEQMISTEMCSAFDNQPVVFVLSLEKLKAIVENNPYQHDKENNFVYITFLTSIPVIFDRSNLSNYKNEEEDFKLFEDVIYLYCPNGYGRTKLHNKFWESKLKISATTRNWNTTVALLNLLSN